MYTDLDATITRDDPKGNVVASLFSTSFLKSRRGFNINDLRVFLRWLLVVKLIINLVEWIYTCRGCELFLRWRKLARPRKQSGLKWPLFSNRGLVESRIKTWVYPFLVFDCWTRGTSTKQLVKIVMTLSLVWLVLTQQGKGLKCYFQSLWQTWERT